MHSLERQVEPRGRSHSRRPLRPDPERPVELWVDSEQGSGFSFAKILPQGSPDSLYVEFRQAFSALGLTREDEESL